jgi:hypothetical protein
MRALDLKLFRDLARLWAQALAIALVVAGGVATLVLAVGSFRSLEETRNPITSATASPICSPRCGGRRRLW